MAGLLRKAGRFGVRNMDEKLFYFRKSADVITEITGLQFRFFENDVDVAEFREEHCFFAGQSEFSDNYIGEMGRKLSNGRMIHVRDELGVNFLFFIASGCTAVAGPFVTESPSLREIRQILEKNRMTDTDALALEVYISRFPIVDEGEVVRIVRAIRHGIYPEEPDARVTQEIYEPRTDLIGAAQTGPEQRINYTLLLEKRYSYERAFRRNIMEGDARSAIMNLRNMNADTAYLAKAGNSLDNIQAGAAIVRTTARLAALDGGLSDIIADRISTKNAQEERRARSREEAAKYSEIMVRNYCRAIRILRQDRYSALVQSVIYQIEHHYQDDISLTDLADELAVSKNYLIQRFKAETGETPVRFLTDFRMKRAAQLLAEQELSIQEIASVVGVPDSNYFTKLFKKTYGVTPKQYRKDRIV